MAPLSTVVLPLYVLAPLSVVVPAPMATLATGVFRPMHARRAHWQTPEAGKLCAIRLIRPDDGFSCHFPAIFSLSVYAVFPGQKLIPIMLNTDRLR